MVFTTPARGSRSQSLGPRPQASDLLHNGRGQEFAGCLPEAIECYEAAIALAEKNEDHTALAEALRRLAEVRYKRGESPLALELSRRSFDVARAGGKDLLP